MSKNTKRELYSMQLFDCIYLDSTDYGKGGIDYFITRVPGGWIFRPNTLRPKEVFVPFNNEFQEV